MPAPPPIRTLALNATGDDAVAWRVATFSIKNGWGECVLMLPDGCDSTSEVEAIRDRLGFEQWGGWEDIGGVIDAVTVYSRRAAHEPTGWLVDVSTWLCWEWVLCEDFGSMLHVVREVRAGLMAVALPDPDYLKTLVERAIEALPETQAQAELRRARARDARLRREQREAQKRDGADA